MVKFSKQQKIIILLSALLICLGVVIFLLINNRADDLPSEFADIDLDIKSGFTVKAIESLDSLYITINNSKKALMFLKRCEMIGTYSGDYTELINYAEKFYSRFNNNIEIAAIYSYALQKSGNYKRSQFVSEDKLAGSIYNDIYLLDVLKNNIKIQDRSILKKIDDRILFIFTEQIPTSEELITAYEFSMDERYLLDAAVSYAKAGELETAYDFIKRSSDSSFNEPKMILAYDNNDYKAAELFYNKIDSSRYDSPNIFLTGCDILMKNKKYSEALSHYRMFIKRYPDLLSLPYRNIYSIEKKQGLKNSRKWIYEGLELFPDSRELLISLAWELYINNEPDIFQTQIENLNLIGEEPLSDLFKINMFIDSRSPEHIIGNFWNVFNSMPHSETTAIAFANYLLENSRYDQLALLLKKYSSMNPENQWLYNYESIGKVLTYQNNEAILLANKAVEIDAETENIYNKGVVEYFSGNYERALISFQEALAYEENHGNNPDKLYKIYYKLSETNYNIKDYVKARYYIKYCLDINPDNIKSGLLLKKIQGKQYD